MNVCADMKAHFILRSPLQRSALSEFLLTVPADPVHEVIIREHKSKRSTDQSAMAWVIVTAISEQVELDGRRYSKEVWWLHLKRSYFGPEFEQMPDGRIVEIEPRSRCKDTKEFSDWLEFLQSTAISMDVVLEAHDRYGIDSR